MIRINLLSTPRAKAVQKQWDVRLELISAVVLLILTVAGWMFYGETLESDIADKQH